jgi:hypothetical protein
LCGGCAAGRSAMPSLRSIASDIRASSGHFKSERLCALHSCAGAARHVLVLAINPAADSAGVGVFEAPLDPLRPLRFRCGARHPNNPPSRCPEPRAAISVHLYGRSSRIEVARSSDRLIHVRRCSAFNHHRHLNPALFPYLLEPDAHDYRPCRLWGESRHPCSRRRRSLELATQYLGSGKGTLPLGHYRRPPGKILCTRSNCGNR